MYATIPVYYPSLEEAARSGEGALWCDSYNINMACRNFLQDRAAAALTAHELDELITDLVEDYGIDRAMYVLSRTVQFSKWDSRFDGAVRERAGGFDFPDSREQREAQQTDPTLRYVAKADPCVLNALFLRLMELEEQEKANDRELDRLPHEPDEGISAEL